MILRHRAIDIDNDNDNDDDSDDDEEQGSDRDAVVGHPLVGHPCVPAVAPVHWTTGDQHLGSCTIKGTSNHYQKTCLYLSLGF